MDGSVDTNQTIVVHCEAATLRNQSLNHTLADDVNHVMIITMNNQKLLNNYYSISMCMLLPFV